MSGWRGLVKGLVGAGLLMTLILTASCSSGSDLTREDLDKLELGMPVSEAESILGLKLEGVKEVTFGVPLTTGRFGPADGPHIGVIAQDLGGTLEIRQLEWVEDGETICTRTFAEDTCSGGGG
jgi:hypothetical protein